jgi:hypothetical protein
VRACLDSSCHNGYYGIPRPDVGQSLALSFGDQSGFEIVVPVFAGLREYRLEAQVDSDCWQEFGKISIRSTSPKKKRLRRGRLYRYFLGRFSEYPLSVFDPDSAFRSWLDRPAGIRLESRRFAISGWIFHRGGAPVTAVRAITQGVVHDGNYGISRSDVAAVYGRRGLASGFEIGIELQDRCTDCELEAQLDDGYWYRFHCLQFRSAFSSLREQRLRWMTFWRKAVKGDPSAWKIIQKPEQEYLLAMARQRGVACIGTWNQHAPRPVLPEPYPTTGIASNKLPVFAIVTPSFNQGDYIEATMRSVLDQQGVLLDYVIQDGGSTDSSRETIQRIGGEYGADGHAARSVRWSSEPDCGQADALNKGFKGTQGGPDDLMFFLNSDDVLMPNALRFVAEFFAANPAVDVVYGHRVIIDEDGLEIGRWYSPRPEWDDVRLFDLIPQETLFWRRRVWTRVGGVDSSFQYALDWDLILRFKAAGARFVRLPWFIGQFRFHSRQKTSVLLHEFGIPESEKLRFRTFGKVPSAETLQSHWNRALFDSALVQTLLLRGRRV